MPTLLDRVLGVLGLMRAAPLGLGATSALAFGVPAWVSSGKDRVGMMLAVVAALALGYRSWQLLRGGRETDS